MEGILPPSVALSNIKTVAISPETQDFECNGLVTTVSAPAPPPDAKKAAQTSGGERGYICRETCGSGHGPRGCAPQEPECASLVPIDIKHSGQSGHLQQVVDSLVQIYEPKLATLIANCGVSLN